MGMGFTSKDQVKIINKIQASLFLKCQNNSSLSARRSSRASAETLDPPPV